MLITQLCLTLCDPLDCTPPGSSVRGILPRQEYRSVLPFSSAGNLPDPGIKPRSPVLQTDYLPGEPCEIMYAVENQGEAVYTQSLRLWK